MPLTDIPPHYFRALCQNASCRSHLGGFHIPCVGGMVVYDCGKCGTSSAFKNYAFGIRAVIVPPKKK